MNNARVIMCQIVFHSCGFACLLTGLVLFCNANVYAQRYDNAILIGGYTEEYQGKRHGTFDVVQIFLKSNYTQSTCSVSRNKQLNKKDAQQFIDNMVLGTTRTLYRSYNKDTCFDNGTKIPDTIAGYVLISFSCVGLLFCCCCGFPCFAKDNACVYMEHTNEHTNEQTDFEQVV